MAELYIGIDGGGTHSTAVSVRPNGQILSRREGGGLNYLTDGLETCIGRFREMTERMLVPGAESVTVCAGLAALDGPAPEEILRAFGSVLPCRCRLLLESDLSVALAGHTLGGPGLMAVCGTGSMALVRDRAGRERAAGGWGWKIGDPGSGFSLAREALFRALFRHETEGRESALLAAALKFFSAPDARSLLTKVYAPEAGTDALAGFGAEAVRLAEQGDPDAAEILARQMADFAALAASLLETVPEAKTCVGLYGGVFQHSGLARKLFSDALQARCPGVGTGLPEYPPEMGAVILAMIRDGLDPQVLRGGTPCGGNARPGTLS